MSHLFLPTSEGYVPYRLEPHHYRLLAGARAKWPELVATELVSGHPRHTKLMYTVPRAETPDSDWVLFVGQGKRALVNGECVDMNVALLRHRDEIRIGESKPMYFSSEPLAAVEPYLFYDSPRCPRCVQPIEKSQLAVRCPGCALLHHQLLDRPCWTYAERCASCDHTTEIGMGLRWTPEGL